jgi:hypothetical protein
VDHSSNTDHTQLRRGRRRRGRFARHSRFADATSTLPAGERVYGHAIGGHGLRT